MKYIGQIVGWSTFLAILAYGTIILFGNVRLTIFPYAYFFFLILLFGSLLIFVHSLFEKKTLFALVISMILVFLSLTLYLTELKVYDQKANELSSKQFVLEQDILNLQQKQQYYHDYISYELAVIAQYQNITYYKAASAIQNSGGSSSLADSTIRDLQQALLDTKSELETTQTELAQAQYDLANQEPQYIYIHEDDD